MLRTLFQGLEQSLGPFFSQAAALAYWAGLIFLLVIVLVPIYRVWMDYATARTGLEQYWIMTCGQCGRRTIVAGRKCGHCESDLGIPWTVWRWTASSRKRESWLTRRIRWGAHLLGAAGFLLLSVWLLNATGALAPRGELHRFLLGIGFLSWAAVGWLGGRALRIGPGGLLGRVRDAVMALAAVGVMAVALLLAHVASPIAEVRLARFSTEAGVVRIGDRVVAIPTGEIGFEYLQLDQDLLGYHRVISMAFVGAERVPVPRRTIKQSVLNHLWESADAYTTRGLRVRLRSERFRVQPGHSYEVIERDGQVLLRGVGVDGALREGGLPLWGLGRS